MGTKIGNKNLIIKLIVKENKNEADSESSTDKISIDSARKDEALLGKNNLTQIDTNIYSVIKSVC